MKVAIVYKIFNNYRKAIFDRLAEKVDLVLLHSKDSSGIKMESAPYSVMVANYFYGSKTTQVWLFIEKQLLKLRPEVVIHEFNPSLISLHITYLYCKIFRKKLIVWGHGYNKHEKFNRNSFKIRFRFLYLKTAHAIILYGQEDKKFFSQYFPVEKLFVAQNTLDTDQLKKYRGQFDLVGKEAVKRQLGYRFAFNIIYIGRIIEGKRPDILADLCKMLVEQYNMDVGFQVIGTGPFLEDFKNSLKEKGVHERFSFHGEIHEDDVSGKHLYASDLFVMPGYLGLSVNHAMCFDCPVVSFREGEAGPHHSPEVEYVIDNQTGYLAKNWDTADMAEWIVKYYRDKRFQEQLFSNIRYAVDNTFPIHKMVDGIYDAIQYSLKKETSGIPAKK